MSNGNETASLFYMGAFEVNTMTKIESIGAYKIEKALQQQLQLVPAKYQIW